MKKRPQHPVGQSNLEAHLKNVIVRKKDKYLTTQDVLTYLETRNVGLTAKKLK
jgi:hypothetical protein